MKKLLLAAAVLLLAAPAQAGDRPDFRHCWKGGDESAEAVAARLACIQQVIDRQPPGRPAWCDRVQSQGSFLADLNARKSPQELFQENAKVRFCVTRR